MNQDMAMPGKRNEMKGAGKIKEINITIVENGFEYRASAEIGNSRNYVYKNTDEVLKAVEDDLTSLHLRVAKKGATNPDALAAWIGRKKYGKAKFPELGAKGRVKDLVTGK